MLLSAMLLGLGLLVFQPAAAWATPAVQTSSPTAVSARVPQMGGPVGPDNCNPCSGDSFRIIDVATNRCLDSNGAGSVYTLTCNGGNYQRWHKVLNSGYPTLVDVATGRCLSTTTTGHVSAAPCNGTNTDQQWIWNYPTNPHRWIPASYGWLCLDSNGSGSVYTLACNGGNYQLWLQSA
jgi:hypothetical protein